MGVDWNGINELRRPDKRPQTVRKAVADMSSAVKGDGAHISEVTIDQYGTKGVKYSSLMDYLLRDKKEPEKRAAHLIKPGEEEVDLSKRYASPHLGQIVDTIVGQGGTE